MTVRERVLALRLMERGDRNPDRMKQLGISVQMERRPSFYQKEKGK